MEINIKHIAELAMLEINDNEANMIAEEMLEMIDMVSDLPELYDESCMSCEMELREDKAAVCEQSRENLLNNAPETYKNCFTVPRAVKH